METPLRERSDGHADAAPTGSFGWIARGLLVSFGWITRKWLFCLCGIAWKNMMEMGRGGACVPARVAPKGRIHRSFPAHHACIFGMETPLCGRSDGHIGTAPTASFGRIARGWLCLLGKRCTRTNTIGVVLLSAQGCRRKEATLGKVVEGKLCHRHCTF